MTRKQAEKIAREITNDNGVYLSRGSYVGTGENIAGRWYWQDGSTVADYRGRGYATIVDAVVAIQAEHNNNGETHQN